MLILLKQVYVTLLLALFVRNAAGIECYQCNSELETGCESVDSRHLRSCDGDEQPVCRKVSQIVYFTKEPRKTTIRTCANNYTHMTCSTAPFASSAKQIVCDCDSDGCNGCHTNSAKVVVVFVMFLTTILSRLTV